MGLFSRKPKTTTDAFCSQFYDSFVFAPAIAGIDPWAAFCETNRNMIGEHDSAFLSVDLDRLMAELRTLRLEVFGIAWLHHVKDTFAPVQSDFTMRNLHDRGASDLWDGMETYNQATARSTSGGYDPKSATGRSYLTFLSQMRTSLFDSWVEQGFDPKVAARAANRLGSDVPWKANRTHTYLSFTLTDRLAVEIKEEARVAILAVIDGFYGGAKEAIQEVRITE